MVRESRSSTTSPPYQSTLCITTFQRRHSHSQGDYRNPFVVQPNSRFLDTPSALLRHVHAFSSSTSVTVLRPPPFTPSTAFKTPTPTLVSIAHTSTTAARPSAHMITNPQPVVVAIADHRLQIVPVPLGVIHTARLGMLKARTSRTTLVCPIHPFACLLRIHTRQAVPALRNTRDAV